MTTYYDAPEPDDLQRRCWIIDDGQCRLYNGHEGLCDFGGGAGNGADPYAEVRDAAARESDPMWRRGALWAAAHIENAARALATPDRADRQAALEEAFRQHYATQHPAHGCSWVCARDLAPLLATPEIGRASAEPRPDRADPERPEIVVLCGSTRFYDDFQQANYDHTMAGRIVLSVGFYPHAKAEHGHGEGVGHDSEQKVALDELHKRKIDLADWVYVLNRGGYIGESTRSEIDYARAIGKPVRYAFDTDGVGSLVGWDRPDHDRTNAKVGR